MYRIVANPNYTPAELALAKRYSTLEGAFADMGTGMIIGPAGGIVAFHERHLDLLQRRFAA